MYGYTVEEKQKRERERNNQTEMITGEITLAKTSEDD